MRGLFEFRLLCAPARNSKIFFQRIVQGQLPMDGKLIFQERFLSLFRLGSFLQESNMQESTTFHQIQLIILIIFEYNFIENLITIKPLQKDNKQDQIFLQQKRNDIRLTFQNVTEIQYLLFSDYKSINILQNIVTNNFSKNNRMNRRSAHNLFTIQPSSELQIQLASNFDSGNLQSATLLSCQQPQQSHQDNLPTIKIQFIPAAEPFNSQYSIKPSMKTFFHFSVKSNKSIIIHACIRRMNILSIIEGSFNQIYRICVGRKKIGYELPQYVKQNPQFMVLYRNGDDHVLQFKYQVNQNEKIYFSYHFPYSFQKLCHFLQDLDDQFRTTSQNDANTSLLAGIRCENKINHNIYYKNQLLIQSVEGRHINLLTITEISSSLQKAGFSSLTRQPRISKSLFPYFDIEERPFKFNKPYIMITSRVHPGQTSASYALEGFIKRLLGSSQQAQFLRKTFVFLIVPMINPDGVYHGTYRMDTLGHNLNRFYNNCAPHKQPAIFAISSLLQHHSDEIVAFFDLHSHPQGKGSFAYGNAYAMIEDQVQSQIFTKLLAINSQSFNYDNCSFSQKNMNSKDINDILTKDGSSRVCAYKKMLLANLCNGVHCYALELGYHGCPVKKEPLKLQQIHQFKSPYRRATKQFDINDYLEHGTDIINTLAQVYIQTLRGFPYSQNIQNDTPCQTTFNNSLASMRQQLVKQLFEKDDRFRILDTGITKKLRNIQSVICTNIYGKIVKKYPQIIQNIKEYDNNKKLAKQAFKSSRSSIIGPEIAPVEKSSHNKVIHSLQLSKNHESLGHRRGSNNSHQINQEQLMKLREKFHPKQVKNIIFRSKQKIKIVPLQFNISNSKNFEEKYPKKRQIHFNRILELQADSLPRIEKKKFNILTQRHKLKRRIQSSVASNNHNFIRQGLPVSRGGLERGVFRGVSQYERRTIDSNIDGIIQYENVINLEGEEDDSEVQQHFNKISEEYKQSYNPETNNQLNRVRNEGMFPRKGTNQLQQKKRIEINNLTERTSRRLQSTKEKKRSRSKEKLIISQQNQNLGLNVKAFPRLQSRTQKIRNKFDLQLQMKQKYDKEYKLDEKIRLESQKKGDLSSRV